MTNIFSFPRCRSIQKSTREDKHIFLQRHIGLVIQLLFKWRPQHEDILGPQVLWWRVRELLIRPARTPCCIRMLTVKSEASEVLLCLTELYRSSYCFEKWRDTCYISWESEEQHALEETDIAVKFSAEHPLSLSLSVSVSRLYAFTSAWISPAITALWLNDWNKWFQSIWGWAQM